MATMKVIVIEVEGELSPESLSEILQTVRARVDDTEVWPDERVTIRRDYSPNDAALVYKRLPEALAARGIVNQSIAWEQAIGFVGSIGLGELAARLRDGKCHLVIDGSAGPFAEVIDLRELLGPETPGRRDTSDDESEGS